MSSTSTADDPAAFVERALSEAEPAAAVRLLRTCRRFESAVFAVALNDGATPRLWSDPFCAFQLAVAARFHARRGEDLIQTARALRLSGQAATALGRPRKSFLHLARAEGAYLAAGDESNAAVMQVRMMHPLAALGHAAAATAAGERALAFGEATANGGLVANAHSALGGLLYERDAYAEAIPHYRKTIEWYQSIAAGVYLATAEANLANCLAAMHRVAAALRHFDRARAAFEANGAQLGVAACDRNRAYAEFVRGHLADALNCHEAALTIGREAGNVELIAGVLVDRAEVYLQMGMTAEARESAREGAAVIPEGQLFKQRALAKLYGAIAALLEGRFREAERTAEEAKETFDLEDNEVQGALCDVLRAMALLELGERDEASWLARRAQKALLLYGRVARAGSADLLLARIDLLDGDADSAVSRINRASARAAGLDTPWHHLELLRMRGLAELAQGRFDAGVASLKGAASVLEEHRGRVPADEFMVSFLASKASLYDEIVGALARQGDHQGAFEYSERSRSRALVDMLWARGGRGILGSKRALASGRLRHLRAELNGLYNELHGLGMEEAVPREGRVSELRTRARKLEADLARRLRDAQASDPEFVSLRTVGAPELEQVQALLDDDTTLIEYFVAGDRVHAFVVTRAGFEHRELAISVDQVRRIVQKFRFHMAPVAVPDVTHTEDFAVSVAATNANLTAARESLFDPLRALVRGSRIVFIPHGELHNLPFHAFPDGDSWLGATYALSYAPSAGVLHHCRDRGDRADGPPAVLALPDRLAPSIEAEARVVDEVVGDARIFEGPAATWDALVEASRTSRILHIATHGQFSRQTPMASSLRLADRWTTLYDLYDLDVRAELVVLSACETGSAHISAGDELLGLMRGFLYAGAPRLLLTQWRLDDQAATAFMHSFYGALVGGASAVDALRTAMGHARERCAHPYFWAPFFLVGGAG